MKKLTVSLLGLISILFATSAPAQVPSDQARMYQIDATHTGSVTSPGLTPPLKQKWSVNFGQSISYPIIADGKVFVTVRNASSSGTVLYALDGASGTTTWSFALGGNSWWSALCYENGRVFAVNGSGMLRGFDAAAGSVVWSRQLPGQNSFSSAPTVSQGVIYTGGAGSGGTVYAVSADTGIVLWTAPVANGDQSSPAVTTDGVYVSYSCPNVYKLNPANGALIWKNNSGCSGGGGKTPALYNGRLYVRDYNPDYIFDSQTGGIAGSLLSKSVPAFSGNMGFFMNGPKYFGSHATLEGRDVNTNLLVWSFGGDGLLQSSMLVVNDYVYVGSSSGKLYAVEAATGHQVWSATAGTSIPYVDEQNVSQPLTGFAAGEGILVVPTNNTLVAYEADPVPTITWDSSTPAPNTYGWNNTPVQISFTAFAHPSGNTFSTPGSPIQFNSEGSNQTQQVTVTDEAGHSATITSPAVNIDWTAPVTNRSLSGTVAPGISAWYTSAVQVTLSASDSLSGVRNRFYSVDSGATQTYFGPFSISSDGSHSVNYWSTDSAGNVEAQQSVLVNIDRSGPATQASVAGNSSNGWYSDPAQVSLTASDAFSGVANSFYTLDGGPAQTYAGPFTVAGEANHAITYWSVDGLGNVETSHSLSVKIDASAPTTQLSVIGLTPNNGWYRVPSVQVALSATDSRSGVGATYYTVNGGATQTYAGYFTLNASAVYQVSFWSVDKVGNSEAQHSFDVKIDNDGPRTYNEVSGPGGGGNYYKGAVQMSLTATDNVSGVANTYYQIDGGPTETYAAPFTVSGDGTHPVHFWSVDVAGNNTYSYTVNISIDGTAPTTQAALSATASGNGWYSIPVQVTLSATDNTSGIANTYYAIDGGLQQTYSTPFIISNTGTHTILYWSKDQANNAESQQSMIIKVDVSAPTTQASVYGSSYEAWYQSPAQVGFTTSDGASGVASTYYTIDGGATQTYAGLFNVSAGGIHTVNYWSVDTAGNVEAQQSLTVKVDNTAPSTQISSSGTTGASGWYRSLVQVSLTAADNNQAGVATTYYRVDGGAVQTYANSFAISTEGVHQVNFWSVDKVGNTEGQKSATVNIDWTGSTVQSAVMGTSGGNNYFKSPVQISLTASDNLSGVAATYYRIDGGATQSYTSTFTVSGDGIHPVDFWSTDVAGNSNFSYTIMIRIDTAGPVTQVAVSGTAGTNGWYRSSVQVSMSATDNFNGVMGIYYMIDNGTTKLYTAPFTVSTVGSHTLTYWSVDNILNTETLRVLPVRIDTSKPNVTASVSPANAVKSNNPVTVTVSGHITDTISGVQPGSASYNVVDEYGVTQPSGPVVLQANGNYSFTLSLPATKNAGDKSHLYTIIVQGSDQAGNAESASDTVKIN